MINILIVDDSLTETALLKTIFESEPDMHVVGCAKNGKEAVDLAATLKPDLITMDIHMPIMDGYEATRVIMSRNPIPIVVISTKANFDTMAITFQALAAGALSVLKKPFNIAAPQFNTERKHIIDTIRSMAEIKVIKRRFNTEVPKKKLLTTVKITPGQYEILAIGASVGGPQVLKTILSNLSQDFPIPIVVVQHMTSGFMSGFAKWLDGHSVLKIKEAQHNEILKKGFVYLAPDKHHLEVTRIENHLVAQLTAGRGASGFCPSVTVLLQSVAKHCGKNAIGLLLTGMGNDGAQGLLELKKAHGHTLIQDPESAIVFGMAGVAQSLGAVDKVVDIDKISDYLNKIVKSK